jgi:hypothetical protein
MKTYLDKAHSLFPKRAWFWALGLLVLLAGVLVSNGRFHSVDELAMFVAAHNLFHEGQPHTNQMGYALWSLRPGEEVVMLGPSGDLYTKKSPLMIVLLLPLVAIGSSLPGVGELRLALLIGPLLTAATAVLLYAAARRLTYPRDIATLAAFLYTFATSALPYSQTIFGELAATFGLLLALFSLLPFINQTLPGEKVGRMAFWCGVGAALAVGVNAVYLPIAALFGLIWLVMGRGKLTQADRLRALFSFALPLLLLGVGLLLYNALRFGDPFTTGYRFAPGQEGFTTPLSWGLAGLLFSPARGLIWYSPPVLLALLGFGRFYRRERPLSWLMLAVIGGQLAAFSLWWSWWGGYGWGPRFLLPIIPYSLLFSLPVLQAGVAGRRWAQTAVALVAILGLMVQVAGTAVDANRYEEWLASHFPAPLDQPLRYHHDPGLVYDLVRSPIIAHWQGIVAGETQPFWWQSASAPRLVDLPVQIHADRRPGDALVFLDPALLNDLLAHPTLPPTFGLPINLPAADPLAQTLWARAQAGADGLWLITWYGPGDPANWYEADLRRRWASISEQWADDLRLLYFARPPQVNGDITTVNVTFQTIRLTGFRLTDEGSILFIELHWQADGPIPEDYTSFVQILSADGRLLVQQDRPPLGGYRPTSVWEPGELVIDRFAFILDNDVHREARIIVGWYSWPAQERLSLILENGETADFFQLNPEN